MAAGLADVVPPGLAPACAAARVDGPRGTLRRASSLRDPLVLDAILNLFTRGYDRPDRDALVSLWSMYYLGALIIPATAARVCLGRVLPIAFDEVMIAVDDAGLVTFPSAAFLTEPPLSSEQNHHTDPGVDTLIQGHVAPFVTLCADRSGLSPRVLWNNAAVMLDFALSTLAEDGRWTDAVEAARTALSHSDERSCLRSPYRRTPDGGKERRVCCLRYRLAECGLCRDVCPRAKLARDTVTR